MAFAGVSKLLAPFELARERSSEHSFAFKTCLVFELLLPGQTRISEPECRPSCRCAARTPTSDHQRATLSPPNARDHLLHRDPRRGSKSRNERPASCPSRGEPLRAVRWCGRGVALPNTICGVRHSSLCAIHPRWTVSSLQHEACVSAR